MNRPRRVFVKEIACAGAVGVTSVVFAQALVGEADPQAKALGYVSDATKVEARKHPKYVVGQQRANCALYQAKANDPAGNCALFGGRQVAAKAWCSAWAKKA